MRSIFTLLLAMINLALSAQIFYLQPFANSSFPAGWSASDGRILISSETPSNGYNPPPASGGFNVRMNDCVPLSQTVSLTVSGVISTVGRTGIRVGFGRRRSNAYTNSVALEWSSDGVNWNLVSSDVAAGSSTAWDAVFYDLPAAAENVANLRFRFSYVTQANEGCAAARNFRIDDFAVGENFSLPIELLRFEALSQQQQVELRWETLSEHNSAWFEVERGEDGAVFQTIGRVAAAGYSEGRRQYTFTDEAPIPGDNFYRLQLIDADGSAAYSIVRHVYVFEQGGIGLFPSPAAEEVHVRLAALEQHRPSTVFWEIRDLLGRTCLQGATSAVEGWTIPVSTLPLGSYVILCTADERHWWRAFFAKR